MAKYGEVRAPTPQAWFLEDPPKWQMAEGLLRLEGERPLNTEVSEPQA